MCKIRVIATPAVLFRFVLLKQNETAGGSNPFDAQKIASSQKTLLAMTHEKNLHIALGKNF